jgi:hypothetical protein
MASHYTQPAARSPKEEPFEDASQRMCLQYVSVAGGSEQKPRDAPTLKRWRDSRRGAEIRVPREVRADAAAHLQNARRTQLHPLADGSVDHPVGQRRDDAGSNFNMQHIAVAAAAALV